MKTTPYSSVVGNLMYVKVCTRLDIAFVVDLLGRYLSDLSQSHWKMAKKVLRYLQGTKNLMLTCRRTDTLEVVGFSDFNYEGYVDDKKTTSGYIFIMTKGAVSWKKKSNRHLQPRLLWWQSMWRVMRLLVMQYGCGTSF